MTKVECVSVITDETYSYYKNVQPTGSRKCGSGFSCPMFTLLKKDFDRIMFDTPALCSSNLYLEKTMLTISQILGLKKEWGDYNKIVRFTVDEDKLYRPISLTLKPNEIFAVRYKSGTVPENLNIENRFKDFTNQNLLELNNNRIVKKTIKQKLCPPFTGTGFTRVGSINLSIKQFIPENIKLKGFKEYILDDNTPIYDIRLYDTYIEYCKNNPTIRY